MKYNTSKSGQYTGLKLKLVINTSRYETATSSSDYIYHMTILRIIATTAYSTSLVWPDPTHHLQCAVEKIKWRLSVMVKMLKTQQHEVSDG